MKLPIFSVDHHLILSADFTVKYAIYISIKKIVHTMPNELFAIKQCLSSSSLTFV